MNLLLAVVFSTAVAFAGKSPAPSTQTDVQANLAQEAVDSAKRKAGQIAADAAWARLGVLYARGTSTLLLTEAERTELLLLLAQYRLKERPR